MLTKLYNVTIISVISRLDGWMVIHHRQTVMYMKVSRCHKLKKLIWINVPSTEIKKNKLRFILNKIEKKNKERVRVYITYALSSSIRLHEVFNQIIKNKSL